VAAALATVLQVFSAASLFWFLLSFLGFGGRVASVFVLLRGGFLLDFGLVSCFL
jgi:hypothetical protein